MFPTISTRTTVCVCVRDVAMGILWFCIFFSTSNVRYLCVAAFLQLFMRPRWKFYLHSERAQRFRSSQHTHIISRIIIFLLAAQHNSPDLKKKTLTQPEPYISDTDYNKTERLYVDIIIYEQVGTRILFIFFLPLKNYEKYTNIAARSIVAYLGRRSPYLRIKIKFGDAFKSCSGEFFSFLMANLFPHRFIVIYGIVAEIFAFCHHFSLSSPTI